MLAVNLGSRGFDEALRHARILQPSRAAPTGATCAARTARRTRTTSRSGASATRWTGPGRSTTAPPTNTAASPTRSARGMKAFDQTLELVACGSSHANMPTYPDWEAEVLDECYDNVDYISLHTYWDNYDNDYLNFLAKSVLLDRYIHTVGGDHRLRQGEEALEARRLHLLRRVERLVPQPQARRSATTTALDWPKAPRAPRGRLQFRGRAAGRLRAQHLHPPRRPREDRLHRAARERDRADHDGERRAGLEADDLLPATTTPRSTAAARRSNVAVDVPTYDAKVADDVPYLDVAAVRERRRQDRHLLHGQPPPGRGDDASTSTWPASRRRRSPSTSRSPIPTSRRPTPRRRRTASCRKRGKGVARQRRRGQGQPAAALLPRDPRERSERRGSRPRMVGAERDSVDPEPYRS